MSAMTTLEKEIPPPQPDSCSSSVSGVTVVAEEPGPGKKIEDLDTETDGGLKGWLTITGAFFAMFVQFGLNNAFGVFQAYYEENQLSHHSADDIGWLGGVQQFLFMFGGLFSGRILDAYGPHMCIVPGSILLVASLMITSVCKKYYQFMLGQAVLFGIGAALVFTPVLSIPNQWFPNRRALATAVAISGSGLGGTLWPIILQRLINTIGFGWALRSAGFISLALLALSCALIRARYPPRKPTPFLETFRCFKDLTWCLMSFGAALSSCGCFVPSFFITMRMNKLGADSSLASYTLSIMLAASIIGRLGAGFGDWTGRFNLNFLSTAALGIVIFAFWIPVNSVRALIAFAVVYGPFFGLVFSLNAPCIAQISKPSEVGARAGMMFALAAPFNLVAVPITGAIVAAHPGEMGFRMAGVFGGCLALAGAALILWAKLRVDPRLFAKV